MRKSGLKIGIVAVTALLAAQLNALTLDDLRSPSIKTPKDFVRQFARFRFELSAEIQDPEVFLAREAGDCDDFATLADLILREKKFTTRLISVRMPHETHVVCYVAESHGYLDFNNRIYFQPIVKCGPSLAEIADAVAKSFDNAWTSTSEFVYTNRVSVLTATVTRTQTIASNNGRN